MQADLVSPPETLASLISFDVKRDSHLDSLVPASTDNLVSHKVDAVYLVRMPREIYTDLERLEIP